MRPAVRGRDAGGATLVTGASSGIGRALARSLAAQGAVVVAVARRGELLEALVGEIAAAGGRAHAIACDVTDRDQVSRALAAAESAAGPIERLVLCAGGGERSPADRFDAGLLERTLSLNVMGAAHCIDAALPGMLERGRGHIVAVSSLAAMRGLPGGAEYSAAKAALSTLLEGWRVALRPRGVDVTILSPGFVRVNQARKRRPLEVPLDAAVARMVRAIGRRRRVCAFPLSLVLVLGLLRCLPPAWADAILGAFRSRV